MAKLFKSFRIDPDIYAMLERQAKDNRRSMGAQIEFLVLKEEKEIKKEDGSK